MRLLAGIALALAIILSGVSAHLRTNSTAEPCASLSERSVDHASSRAPWSAAHRVLASGLGLAVIALNVLAWGRTRPRPARVGAALALAVVVTLAALGPWSGPAAPPTVQVTNIAGGLGLIALLAWLWRLPVGDAPRPRRRAGRVAWAGALIAFTTVTGAVAAIRPSIGSPCGGALDYLAALGRETLDLTPILHGSSGPATVAIHVLHLLGALLTFALMGLLWLQRDRRAFTAPQARGAAMFLAGGVLALAAIGNGGTATLVHHLGAVAVLTGATLTISPPPRRA